MKIWVEFTDDTKSTVGTAYPSGLGDPEDHPLAEEIDTSDPRWKAYYDSLPFFLQQGMPNPNEG
jgi:hypothetical protein